MATSETHVHDFDPLLGPLEGVGPINLEFFVMDLPASKSLRPASKQVH